MEKKKHTWNQAVTEENEMLRMKVIAKKAIWILGQVSKNEGKVQTNIIFQKNVQVTHSNQQQNILSIVFSIGTHSI